MQTVKNYGGSKISETGRRRFWGARFQTPSSVNFIVLTEFRGENSFSSLSLFFVFSLPKQYSARSLKYYGFERHATLSTEGSFGYMGLSLCHGTCISALRLLLNMLLAVIMDSYSDVKEQSGAARTLAAETISMITKWILAKKGKHQSRSLKNPTLRIHSLVPAGGHFYNFFGPPGPYDFPAKKRAKLFVPVIFPP